MPSTLGRCGANLNQMENTLNILILVRSKFIKCHSYEVSKVVHQMSFLRGMSSSNVILMGKAIVHQVSFLWGKQYLEIHQMPFLRMEKYVLCHKFNPLHEKVLLELWNTARILYVLFTERYCFHVKWRYGKLVLKKDTGQAKIALKMWTESSWRSKPGGGITFWWTVLPYVSNVTHPIDLRVHAYPQQIWNLHSPLKNK